MPLIYLCTPLVVMLTCSLFPRGLWEILKGKNQVFLQPVCLTFSGSLSCNCPFVLFLKHIKSLLTSGHLPLPLPLPRTFFLHISMCQAPSHQQVSLQRPLLGRLFWTSPIKKPRTSSHSITFICFVFLMELIYLMLLGLFSSLNNNNKNLISWE